MNKLSEIIIPVLAVILSACSSADNIKNDLRAPAYPLVTIDPYMSAWSPADNLYDANVIHWTEREFPLIGVLKVDGQQYRFLGIENDKVMTPVAPMGKELGWEASYTFEKPAEDWTSADYDYSGWKHGAAPFGDQHEEVNTPWNKSSEIWLRREFTLDKESITDNRYYLYYTHDGQVDLFINGDKVVSTGNVWKENARVEITKEQLEKWGEELTIAAHCEWFSDGRYIDFGIYHNDESEKRFPVPAKQISADAQATRTIYDFVCGGVDMKLTFMAPMLMEDPELVSRPVNYISYELASNDGADHDVEIHFEAAPHWARNTDDQECISEILKDERFAYARCGTKEQNILGRNGDHIRIDWGYFYLAGDKGRYVTGLKEADNKKDMNMTLASNVMKISGKPVKDYIMIGYDDIYAIRYFDKDIRPYWNRKGDSSIEKQFALAADQYKRLVKRCERFDVELMRDAFKAGGKEYAELCALAYRQSMAAHKLIEMPNGEMAWLSKENSSNGCIGTVDVTYPSFPMYLYYNVDFAKALINFIFDYSENGTWDEAYAPHDVGTYPHVFGQRYGGGMPVEESGNMLVLTGAICKMEGKADYAMKHWEVLTEWADYLTVHGGDPGNQLCTDDFMGHSARNANLAVKGILGVAAYADMAKMAGMDDVHQKYHRKAKEMAADWKRMANEDDHYRLTFDPGKDTWSQKYNLVWDDILGYDVFDDDITETEIAYYLTKLNKYGLPLDSRDICTKSDWVVWTATMADDNETFGKFIIPMHAFYNDMTGRVPMPDLYRTMSSSHSGGWLQARSVVGGYWMKMLSDRMAGAK